MRTFSRQVFPVVFSLIPVLFSGCGSLSYLYQAGMGQMSLISHARPISDVLRDERVPPRTRGLLAKIDPIKKFGEEHGLKPTSNYTEFVQLKRKAAVWVVSACEPLRFKAKEWKFPLVGSFPYLGWFDQESAKQYAAEVEKEGWDVNLRGASAYSTLGWFRDAVLSTMISEGPEALGNLSNVVLHESVHATLYIKGQAYFDESLASFVADRLTMDYLENGKEKQAYVDQELRQREAQKRFHEVYEELNALYSSQKADEEKLQEKQRIFKDLASKYGSPHQGRGLNNANIVLYKTYSTGETGFQSLLEKCNGDWPRFMAAIARLKPESFSKPQQEDFSSALTPLIESGC